MSILTLGWTSGGCTPLVNDLPYCLDRPTRSTVLTPPPNLWLATPPDEEELFDIKTRFLLENLSDNSPTVLTCTSDEGFKAGHGIKTGLKTIFLKSWS